MKPAKGSFHDSATGGPVGHVASVKVEICILFRFEGRSNEHSFANLAVSSDVNDKAALSTARVCAPRALRVSITREFRPRGFRSPASDAPCEAPNFLQVIIGAAADR